MALGWPPGARIAVAVIALCSLTSVTSIECTDLYPAMICCAPPMVDEHTQSAAGCTSDRVVSIRCYARDGVTCTRSGTAQTYRSLTEEGDAADAAVVLPGLSDEVERCAGDLYNVSDAILNTTSPCAFIDPDNLHKFWVATALSVFLGPLGFDRFYLGYYGVGLAKLCSGGFLCIGWLVDIVLISLQIVTPADGTDYFMGYYASRFSGLSTPGGGQDDVFEDFTCAS
eukprot:m.19681 g.19681  ORF g.19681 m.19681 type:complete len:227 (+) comp10026_c0_seq1:205-885(+)